jgi:drug/metabolite transporter (DMT)-like permease
VVDAPVSRELVELEHPARHQRPLLGYAMVTGAVTLWAVNGTVSKVILQSGIPPLRLSELRTTGGALLFLAATVLVRPERLRLHRSELVRLLAFGLLGLAAVQALYFISLERLDVGVALVIEYIAPVIVALYARFVVKEPMRRRAWLAIAIALAGLTLVVDLWGGITLDGIGVGASVLAAFTFAAYALLAERSLHAGRDVVSLLAYGFLVAAIFWAFAQPWWNFPFDVVTADVSMLGRVADVTAPVWLLLVFLLILGTFVPFLLMIGALQHVRATRVMIVAMLEPVLGAVVAFAWLAESLTPGQIAGGLLVIAGVGIAQSARPPVG